jgi:hypothetical protein
MKIRLESGDKAGHDTRNHAAGLATTSLDAAQKRRRFLEWLNAAETFNGA